MPKPFNFNSTVGVCITRGGPTGIIVGVPEALPFAGVDQTDGTAALLVQLTSGSSGGSGGSTANTGIPTAQYTITALATAVKVSQVSPASTRFSVWVTNIGNNTVWIGPAGVTDSSGIPIYSGATVQMPVGSAVSIYAYSPAGSTVATMEFQ